MGTRKRRFAAGLVALAATATMLVACERPGPQVSAPKEAPNGDVYTPPEVLPPGFNGDLIYYQSKTDAKLPGTKMWSVLYRSINATGKAIPVSGLVIVPDKPWTGEGKRPIVALAPQTIGVTDDCAPSKNPASDTNLDSMMIKAITDAGYAIAMTDYEGMGTPGIPTYMVEPSQSRAVLDSVRAAQRLPGADVFSTSPVALVGYSQGGGAVGAAAEIAATYTPELQIKGIVSGAAPADLIAVVKQLDGGFFGFLAFAAFGHHMAYPELNLFSYLNEKGQTDLTAALNSGHLCLDVLVPNFMGKKIEDYVTRSPLLEKDWQDKLALDFIGNGKPSAPVLLYQGKDDQVIPVAVVAGLRDRWCAKGATVDYQLVPSEHVASSMVAIPKVLSYLSDRFTGKPAPNVC